MHHSKQKSENKGKTPPALKAAVKGPSLISTLTVTSTKEMTDVVEDTGDSKTSALAGRQQSAAAGAQAERSPVEATGEAVAQVLERPYTTSYFLPGKLERRAVRFLIDTGCTTNLLSKHVLDQLPEQIKSGVEESDSHGIMADGTQLPFYGVLRLPLRVRDVKAEEVFVVSRINEDAILGMPFLVAHKCTMEFNQPIVQVGSRKLECTDRHGRLLVSSVQTTRGLVVPPRTEMAVPSRVNTRKFCPLEVIEGRTDRPPRKPPEPSASPPVSPRATDNFLPEGEAQERRRWQTNTSPRIEVVEVHARTNLERLLGRKQPSKSIPGLRARRAAMLEQDADDIEYRARRVDDVRRGSRLSQAEEESLRRESAQLRTEAAKFRQVVELLYV